MMRALRRCALSCVIALAACGPGTKDPGEGLVSITIEPENATLTFTGTPASLDYKAIGHYEDGTTAELPDATFSLDATGAQLGTMTDATFTASGQGAGKGGVYAQVGDQMAATSVIVTVHVTDLGPGVPPGAEANFPDSPPVAAGGPALVYPLDKAVMPTSVKAPVVQWEGPSGADHLYRLRMTTGFATVDTIVSTSEPDFTFATTPTTQTWELLKTSSAGGSIKLDLASWDPTNGPRGAAPAEVKVIPADIAGAIYYWNLGAGRMERIDANGRAPAIANPPPKPSSPGNRCVACHSVSKDGRYLSGALWGGGEQGAVFDMTLETVRTGDPAPTVATLTEGGTYTMLFSTFNHDGTRLMINSGTALSVIDPASGQPVATQGTPLPTSGAAHPAWSPDGTTVAFVNNVTSGGAPAFWAVDYDRGDLAVMQAGGNDTFGAPMTIVPAATSPAEFPAPSWPTFAPDSTWIAYGAGTNSRGRNDGIPAVYPGALFVVNKDGGTVQRLDIACANQRDCHLPNFSPYDVGGYFWLVFYSTRDYGNAQAGTKGTHRRQLWITAIDKSKLGAGVDPSSVPYWLPDQDVGTENMSAYWSLPAPIQ